MKIMTSWEKRGLEQGLEQGREEGLEQGREESRTLVLKLLKRRLGEITPEEEAQVRALDSTGLADLGDSLLDFTTTEDLTNWLAQHRYS